MLDLIHSVTDGLLACCVLCKMLLSVLLVDHGVTATDFVSCFTVQCDMTYV